MEQSSCSDRDERTLGCVGRARASPAHSLMDSRVKWVVLAFSCLCPQHPRAHSI